MPYYSDNEELKSKGSAYFSRNEYFTAQPCFISNNVSEEMYAPIQNGRATTFLAGVRRGGGDVCKYCMGTCTRIFIYLLFRSVQR